MDAWKNEKCFQLDRQRAATGSWWIGRSAGRLSRAEGASRLVEYAVCLLRMFGVICREILDFSYVSPFLRRFVQSCPIAGLGIEEESWEYTQTRFFRRLHRAALCE